ncbi:MAG TPA: ferritin-like domain-containing protein [Streptomyces sp.]|uniref:ferritin-like domain-containing protein n=1 Tax=Streptomyces sp. TaxID=1931 RepID=UPI002D6104E5|nr:ferritin-like domain-containing protein [Streptomyces sp.]HZG02477.1 ferritin-like domain-containing protein [Streptomyces sp.]
MLWARDLLREALDDDASFRLLCSLAACAEARNGRENGRIAAAVPAGRRDLAPGMAHHGARQDRHARLLGELPAGRGLEPVQVPPEADHALLLEERGACPAHAKLRRGEPLNERDVIAHLAHGHVAETRAAAWLARFAGRFGDHREIGPAVREVARAKREHLAYCREGLLCFARAGHGAAVQWLLRENALAEIRVHRDVGLAVLAHLGHLLGWSMARSVALEARVQAGYAYGRLVGHRRAAHLVPAGRPAGAGAPSGPAATASPGA